MIRLTQGLMKQIYPNAAIAYINALVENQSDMKEILDNDKRATIAFANMHVESRGFTVFIENIHYTAPGMASTWKKRFPGGAADVIAKFGSGAGWQNKAFDDIYGSRMGNRPGTSDGSKFIGRSATQLTGRDGYATVGKMIGIDLVANPNVATAPEHQAAIVQAFWNWKNISPLADANKLDACREAWNGGTNGLADFKSQVTRIRKIIAAYLAVPTAAINVQVPTAPIDETLKAYQEKLSADLGYHSVGEFDGRFGGGTRGAITAFYNDRGITHAAVADAFLYAAIDKAVAEGWHRPIAPERAYATAEDIAPKVPAVAAAQSGGLIAKIGGWASGVFGTIKATVWAFPDVNDQIYPYTSLVQQWYSELPGWVIPVVVAAVAFAIVRQTTKAKTAVVSDYQTGKLN